MNNFEILFAQNKADKNINKYVDEYCEEHFVQETGYVLDDTLTLENAAAQAKAVGDALAGKQDALTFDDAPTSGSSNPVKSGGVYSSIGDVKSGLEYKTMNINASYPIISGEKVASGTGIISPDSNYSRTDYIDLKDSNSVTISSSGSLPSCVWYDKEKVYISGINSGVVGTHINPIGAKYMMFCGTPTRVTNSTVVLNNVPTQTKSLVDFSTPWLYGKRINWIGDSIVAGRNNGFDYYVSKAFNLVENDYGINGSTIALKEDGTDGRNAISVRYSSMTDTTDIIAVSAGANDFEYAWCPIGTINDADDGTSNNTFYGALKALCKGLITKYPRKIIFFTTPIKRAQPFASGAGGEYTPDGDPVTPFSKNKYGKTLGDYADIIKEVCGYYSIPVLDMYNESLLNPSIVAQQDMFDEVLTHPNETGQKIMARRVAGWITQLAHTIE